MASCRFRDPRRVSIVRLGMALAIVPVLLLLCVTFHTADIRNDDDNYNNNHEQAVSLKKLHRRSLLQSGNGLYVDAAGRSRHTRRHNMAVRRTRVIPRVRNYQLNGFQRTACSKSTGL